MNCIALQNGLRVGGIFLAGFLVGAHKYHVLYYLPAILNPQLRWIKPWYLAYEREKVEAAHAAYYKEVVRKMGECE